MKFIKINLHLQIVIINDNIKYTNFTYKLRNYNTESSKLFKDTNLKISYTVIPVT